MPTTTDFSIATANLSTPAITGYPIDQGSYYELFPGGSLDTEVAIEWFGTDATVTPDAATQVSIDGAAFGASSGSNGVVRSIGSGLTNGWHTSIIKGMRLLYTVPLLSVTSSTTPATRAPADSYGTRYEARAATALSCVKMTGGWFSDDTNRCMHTIGWWNGSIFVVASGSNTGLRLLGYAPATITYDVYVDGVLNSAGVVYPNTELSKVMVSGLTPGAHTYELRPPANTASELFFTSIAVIGGALNTTAITYNETITGVGDSVMENSNNLPTTGAAEAFVATIATTRGWDRMNLGVAGLVTPSGSTTPTLTNIVDAVLRVPPRCLLYYLGSNDKLATKTAAQFKIDTQAALQKLLDGTTLHPTGLRDPTTVIVMRPLAWLKAQDADYDQAVIDAVAALSLPASPPTFITHDSSAVSGSALHPDQTHVDAIAADLLTVVPTDADTTPPTVLETSATNIDTTGLVFTAKFDGGVYNSAGAFGTDFSLTSNRGVSHTALEDGTFGDGDDSRQYDVFTNVVYKCETITLNCVSTEITDSAGIDGNHIVTFTGQAVTNNSTVICAVPTGLALTPYATSMRIRWTPLPEPVLASYKIYRSTTLGGTYSLVATVNAPARTYFDSGLSNDQAYYYKITSFDLGGNESAKSAAVNATPTAAAGDEPRPMNTGLGIGIGIGI